MEQSQSSSRKAFDEAVAAMSLTASPYFREYYFYLHLLSQCKIDFEFNGSAPAAVSFDKDTYTLHLNPTKVLIEAEGDNDAWLGFCEDMPIQHRIGILKHEMSHVFLGHLIDMDKLDKRKHNFAADCALNQHINKEHLPKGCIFPENFPTKVKNVLPLQNNEYYYSIIDFSEKKSELGKLLDDHGRWEEGEKNPTIQRKITKDMVEKAGDATYKAVGSYPVDYLDILENLQPKVEKTLESALRKVLATTKSKKVKTLMRKNRRLPNYNWVKGVKKDKLVNVAVISDVSGSVNDKELRALWERILSVCNSNPVTLVQIDAQPKDPEKLTNRTTNITRKAQGGTLLSPALEKFEEFKVEYSVLVVTTDGFLSSNDLVPFSKLKVPVIWLISPKGKVMEGMNQKNMAAIKLKEY